MSNNDTDQNRIDNVTPAIEQYRLAVESYKLELDRYKAENDASKPAVEGIFKFAELTLRSLLILNGGSALGLLTFAASSFKNGGSTSLQLGPPLLCFGAGAALSVCTAGISYLAQVAFVEFADKDGRSQVGRWLRRLAILTATASLAAFAGGMLLSAMRLG